LDYKECEAYKEAEKQGEKKCDEITIGEECKNCPKLEMW
jgi:hypothetical protein